MRLAQRQCSCANTTRRRLGQQIAAPPSLYKGVLRMEVAPPEGIFEELSFLVTHLSCCTSRIERRATIRFTPSAASMSALCISTHLLYSSRLRGGAIV